VVSADESLRDWSGSTHGRALLYHCESCWAVEKEGCWSDGAQKSHARLRGTVTEEPPRATTCDLILVALPEKQDVGRKPAV
jgi:hypothetical protein